MSDYHSNTPSPLASRDSSPSRIVPRTNPPTRPPGRSRKNSKTSSHDTSPARASSTNPPLPPSAAAIARSLSAATTPALSPANATATATATASADGVLRAPTPQKPTVATTDLKDAPRWPVSPRLRSPPPINKPSLPPPRKPDHEAPGVHVEQQQQEARNPPSDGDVGEPLAVGAIRTPAPRGASGTSSMLETVPEISQPNTPALGIDGALAKAEHDAARLWNEQENPMENAFTKTLQKKEGGGVNDSGSDSGGRGDMKMRRSSLAPVAAPKQPGPLNKSYSANPAVGRGKPAGEGSTRNMTVETETVSSIPQIAVAGGPATGGNGSIRAKPSSETIRPKKEKKKTARKTASVNSGTASSKADIFEAKVASAVDEVDSSDSEETFVYESNPPETTDRPRRFHSRTPSATSMASQVDQRNGSRTLEGVHSVAMKKSMKFANSFSSGGPDAAIGEDDGSGTTRSTAGTGRGSTHHHYIGRWGRNGGNGHPSLFDNESPFPNAAKSKLAPYTPRHSSRPTSPRVANMKMTANGKKISPISAGYDLDEGADDERTPLMQSVRSTRSNRTKRPGASSLRQLEHQASRQSKSFIARFAGCCILSFMIILVITGVIGFMFATSQPLTELKVLALKNILASEQDVILDMQVTARNPNLVTVTIDAADIVVFVKSKYAGTDSEWWRASPGKVARRGGMRRARESAPPRPPGGGGDPGTHPNLEIGHVYELDSPLIFDGSPFRHLHASSLGQIRINHPGNKTTPAGSERWGRVLQHEFDLILRGTLRYTLPLSQRVRSVGVEGRVTVKPNAANQDPDAVHIRSVH